MKTDTLNNEKKAMKEISLDELDTVAGGFDRESNTGFGDWFYDWVASWFD